MSHRDFTEVEPQGTTALPAVNRTLFLEKVRQSNAACQNGDFTTAVALYTDALQLDPTNHILYSNRSAARLKQGQFAQALQDAVTARELCPTWPKAYYRQGVALQCLDRHGDALAAFASGLAQDPASTQLLASLIEASIKSPLRSTLEPTFQQLELMKLDQSPFVLISVVGQELLSAGLYQSAVTVLESALRIGSCSLKLRGSVFSALSSAHWALSQLDKAIGYMQQDLAIAKSLGDTAGECRAHGNLGSAYFSQGSYKEALTAHRYQLVLAMKCKDTQAASIALTSLGHVYTAITDYANALASHKQCVQLVKQMGDRLQEAREIGNVGAVYLALGDFDSAVDCHTQHLRIAKRLGNQVEEARAYSNLGSSHHYRRSYAQAMVFHERVLRLAQGIGDKSVEARAYAGLGHAARCGGDYTQAKHWHERQLDMALSTRDKVGEGRACSNLGIVYQLLGEYDAALKLHQAHLAIARNLQDRAGMGRAYGNIGNAYSAAGFYESAVKYHKQELTISKEVHDRSSEASTHGNLAVAYQAIGAHDMALLHYRAHLGIARELKDTAGEACALLNLGNCLSSRSEFPEAIPYYEHYLMLSQELADIEGEAKACHFLGYAHYCIGNYREAVRYYDQDLALAKDLHDKMNMGRAYCNLGLAHLALGQLETGLECQKYFLAIAHMTSNVPGKFRALGNIGDVLVRMGEVEEAIKMYHRQLALARTTHDHDHRAMEATACGALGNAHRLLKRMDKALGYHTQELTLRQEMGELQGECRAHGHLGTVHMALGQYSIAVKCYQEQLERAQELGDGGVEAQAYGNLGIARLNMGCYEDAIGYLEQQLATLHPLTSATSTLDRGRAFGHLGDCYDALGDCDEATKCHEQYLAIGIRLRSGRDQERAYRGLGTALRCRGRLQQALVCLEKRLVVAHEVVGEGGGGGSGGEAYGELGQLHLVLGNLEQAVSCLGHQARIARELNDKIMETEAVSGLGSVYQQMGEYVTALRYHQEDLDISEQLGMSNLQARAFGNLGSVHESLGNYEQAIHYQEQHLSIAASTNDQLAKTMAFSALGRVHQMLGNRQQAVGYLSQGLCIAETLGRRDEEARIRNRLGLALWSNNDLDGAQKQLEAATQLLENIRRDSKNAPDYKLSLFELQTSSYQVLQRVLIGLNRQEDALTIAERGRNRAFVDLLLERQGISSSSSSTTTTSNTTSSSSSTSRRRNNKTNNNNQQQRRSHDNYNNTVAGGGGGGGGIHSMAQLQEIVNKQRATVIYYSLAAGYLYSWLIVPNRGVLKFHSSVLHEGDHESSNTSDKHEHDTLDPTLDPSTLGTGLLERLITTVRDSLGVDTNSTNSCSNNPNNNSNNNNSNPNNNSSNSNNNNSNNSINNSCNTIGEDHQYEDSLTAGGASSDRAGFLRMVNRQHLLNSSNYSLSSLFSVGSIGGGSVASLRGSTRSSQGSARMTRAAPLPWKGPSCLTALYSLLLLPFEEHLTLIASSSTSTSDTSAGNISSSSCSAAAAAAAAAVAGTNKRELILILEGDLYLVPFPLLRGTAPDAEYLCERFSILAAPNLASLRGGGGGTAGGQGMRQHNRSKGGGNNVLLDGDNTSTLTNPSGGATSSGLSPQQQQPQQPPPQGVNSLIVGNPKLPASVTEHYGWRDIPQSEQEATMVAELLQTHALVGGEATKEQVLARIQEAECIHLATHVSWKLSSIVLSPAEVLEPSPNKKLYMSDNSLEEEESNDMMVASADLPPLSEFLLSAADLLSLKLSARLVVISSSHSRDQQGWATSDGLVSLVRALLAAGAQAVLVSLWPVPETATKILLRAFYSALLQGTKAARALSEAMQTVQHTKHFAHPANWAGFLLVGVNVRLSNKVALMGQALCELLKVPDKCRDALRVSLHLVEKSLQRIHRGQKNAMYTTQKSIENKVGSVTGWRELLMSVGFRFEPASNGIPSSVFFPQSDPEERLTQCSASLQALLGLTATSIQALAKLTANAAVAEDIISVIQSALGQFSTSSACLGIMGTATTGGSVGGGGGGMTSGGNNGKVGDVGGDSVDVPLNVRLWRVPGCHELLASLGFDLCDVGQDRVTLRTGKQANKRNIQFTLQALLALFDTQEAPKSLTIDSSSSLESLASVDNDFSHSDNELSSLAASNKPIVNSVIPRVPPPFTRTVLPSKRLGGAFTSYVKRRGEPDGRTANPADTKINLDLGKPRKSATLSRPGGGESDAAFTPSPPVVLQPENQLTLSLAHQTIIRNLYSQQTDAKADKHHRPDSSSSASSATDWESGHNTVLRRQQVVPPIPPPRTSKNLLDLTPLYNNLPGSNGNSAAAAVASSSSIFENSSDSELEAKLFTTSNGHLVNNNNNTGGARHHRTLYTKKSNTTGNTNRHQASSSMSTLDRLSVRTELSNNNNNNNVNVTGNLSSHGNNTGLSGNGNNNNCGVTGSRKIVTSLLEETGNSVGGNNERLLYFAPNDGKMMMAAMGKSGLEMTGKLGQQMEHVGCNNSDQQQRNKILVLLEQQQQQHQRKSSGHHQQPAAAAAPSSNGGGGGNSRSNTLHDTILATQLRHINRELTPTISEVYHERNIGLGLAPPLSKLLLSQVGGGAASINTIQGHVQNGSGGTDSNPTISNTASVLEKITLGILGNDADLLTTTTNNNNPSTIKQSTSSSSGNTATTATSQQQSTSTVAGVGNTGKSKPWLSDGNATATLQAIQSSDLTTADILEREVKNKKGLTTSLRSHVKEELLLHEPKRLSPFSEMSRRDEGDGRSIADSNSSSYKATPFWASFRNDNNKTNENPHRLSLSSSKNPVVLSAQRKSK